MEFIKKYDVKETDIPFLELDPPKQRVTSNPETKPDTRTQEKTLDYQQLDEWAEIMRQEIEIKDYPSGWFGTNYKCTKGHAILSWIQKYAEPDQRKAMNVFKKMLQFEIL